MNILFLTQAIRDVTAAIRAWAPRLRADGTKACVVIASDGEASDGDLAAALRPLRDLPAWVVVRLCTDDDRVVEYWNSVDEDLELDMDVLDDLAGEAAEVNAHQPWLAYGPPLHRLRGWGTCLKVLDLLDERPLAATELPRLVEVILGDADLPHPEVDWRAFVGEIDRLQKRAGDVWDPTRGKRRPWFDVRALNRAHGKGGCALM